MQRRLFFTLLLGVALATSGCTFHSTAKHWNERVDADGHHVYYTSTMKMGFNLIVLLPFLGDLGIDGLVDDMTASIKEEGGDHVRIVQGSTENYWYGWPPFTWIITPVISTVAAEYRPTSEAVQETKKEDKAEGESWLPEM
jgi:hypothetical protein